ncbi:MAG: cation transporter [Defluviicoccus sp.]
MEILVDNLPAEKRQALERGVRLEWITLCVMGSAAVVVGATMGLSQAMKAAWVEDVLGLVPPVLFLVAWHYENLPATAKFPYGFSRIHSIGFILAAAVLVVMGALLLVDSAITLINQDKPNIGTFHLFGGEYWSG